jgi:hypothetical protein
MATALVRRASGTSTPARMNPTAPSAIPGARKPNLTRTGTRAVRIAPPTETSEKRGELVVTRSPGSTVPLSYFDGRPGAIPHRFLPLPRSGWGCGVKSSNAALGVTVRHTTSPASHLHLSSRARPPRTSGADGPFGERVVGAGLLLLQLHYARMCRNRAVVSADRLRDAPIETHPGSFPHLYDPGTIVAIPPKRDSDPFCRASKKGRQQSGERMRAPPGLRVERGGCISTFRGDSVLGSDRDVG